jgi:CHAT domain-containing protein
MSGMSNFIILSACETAKTEIRNGDEIFGLIRGFFYSGASTLIASSWVVDDEGTLALMHDFYRQMMVGKNPPIKAMQKSKQNLLKSEKFSAPFFWASFNTYGIGI